MGIRSTAARALRWLSVKAAPGAGWQPTPLVVTPCTHDMVCLNYLLSVVRLKPIPDMATTSSAAVWIARNKMADHFLKNGNWSHLFFIDSDIGFEPTDFYRLLNSGFDIATAAYPKRNGSAEWVVKPEWVGEVDENGFAPIMLAATGFMCIKREVLVKMRGHYGASEIFDGGRNAEQDVNFGEDIAFCMRWHNIGGTIHVDTRARLTHQGTHLYQGDFMDFVNAGKAALFQREPEAAVA